jgi:molybdate transport system ATP-binding protein
MTIEARFNISRGDFVLEVALSAPGRGVTSVFGPSGCGKTTLLRLIAGLERDPQGYLSVSGDVWQNGHKFLPTHKRAVGYVFQEASLFPHLSVRGNLEFGYQRLRPGQRQVAFDEAVELLGLASLLERRPAGLSGGERQRAAIARTLLASPRLLLMDEPLTALDADSKADILPYLERLHGQLSIPMLYVSHTFDEIARLADHLVLLDKGRVRASGPFFELANRLDSPLADAADAQSVIEAEMTEYDEPFHLARLRFQGGEFAVVGAALPLGSRVRVRVLARDVSLALERHANTSILNVLPAKVALIRDHQTGQVNVSLDLGCGTCLLARITRKSAAALGIEPGKVVFAQIKSVALLGPARVGAD